jgi:hypothetical protein
MDIVEKVKSYMSMGTKRRIARARLALRRPTQALRTLPDFLIIGAQRCGTSSMYKYLGMHPKIVPALRKETEYFSNGFGNGLDWYRAHFPLRGELPGFRRWTFEATPDYLYHPLSAGRIAERLPGAKFIVLLRDPVERAFSHYEHAFRLGLETLPFDEALAREPDRIRADHDMLERDPLYRALSLRRHSYVDLGKYDIQLERWLSFFPRERFVVIRMEDFFADPGSNYREVLRFLGIDDWVPAEFKNHSYRGNEPVKRSKLPDALREKLEATFAPHNRRLNDLLGRDFGWRTA